MLPRQRFIETLTFGRPDRIPLTPGGPRESTLARWHGEGLDAHTDYRDALANLLDIPREAFETTVSAPGLLIMIPTFEEQVLEHRDGHYIVRDWMGATTEISDAYDYTYIRSAKDFVTRKWHSFPVTGPADWEQVAWRYDAHDPQRLPADMTQRARELNDSGLAVIINMNGPFWQMREWVGMEPLCLMMVEQPTFVQMMVDHWLTFTLETLKRIMSQVQVSALRISEDMAYKGHSMISPAMARRYLLPSYLAWVALARSHDVPLIDLDSDGYVGELIPLWIEAGIHCSDPIEVAAGNDIVAMRAQYGREMAYWGGIDKRAIAAGGEVLRQEVARVAPLIDQGGFLPSCDHGVPHDISWANFIDYTQLLARYTGWLG